MPWEVVAVAAVLVAAVVGYLLGRRAGRAEASGRSVGSESMDTLRRQLAEARGKVEQHQALAEQAKAEREQAQREVLAHEETVRSLRQQVEAKLPSPVPTDAAARQEITALRQQVERLQKDAVKAQSEARVFRQNAERQKKAYQEALGKTDDFQQNTDRLKRKLERSQAEAAGLREEIESLKKSLADASRPPPEPAAAPPDAAPPPKPREPAESVSVFDLALQARKRESRSPFDAPSREAPEDPSPAQTRDRAEPALEPDLISEPIAVPSLDEVEPAEPPPAPPPAEPTGPTVLDVIDSDPTLGRGARETIKMVYQRFAPRAATFGSADSGLTVLDVLDADPNLNRGQRETIRTMYGTYVRK